MMICIPAWRARPGSIVRYAGRELRIATAEQAQRHPAKGMAIERATDSPVILCYCEGNIPASILANENVWVETPKKRKNSGRR